MTFYFCPQKVEKTTLKDCSEKTQIHFFSLTASTAQLAKTEVFMFQNVAYRPTVYRTGIHLFDSHLIFMWSKIFRAVPHRSGLEL